MTADTASERFSDISRSMGDAATEMGLDPSLLYAAVIAVAEQGMLTARSVNAAAWVLVKKLGFPPYYFCHITHEGLTEILQALATHLVRDGDSSYRLTDKVAHVATQVGDGIQLFLATTARLREMEVVAGDLLPGRRWEYYCSGEDGYHTYIIKPQECPDTPRRFAFTHDPRRDSVPEETGQRYNEFLAEQLATVSRLVVPSSTPSGETRIMIHKNVGNMLLPAIRERLRQDGLFLRRAYGEPYRTDRGAVASVCSFYVEGTIPPDREATLLGDLRALLSLSEHPFMDYFLEGTLTFPEMLFATIATFFVHQFVFRESAMDRQIMDSLSRADLREALVKRIADANRNEYTRRLVCEALRADPALLKQIFEQFDAKFNPARAGGWEPGASAKALAALEQTFSIRFLNDATAREVLCFTLRMISQTLKTNFYLSEKRSFSFRFTRDVLDPIVFEGEVYGIFFAVGHYSLGTHMRAADIARGGLRLLRTTPATYEDQLDDANLLNFSLGPKAQRLKHKDIAESGSKGVIVPTPEHANDTLNVVFDFTEGILDLVLPNPAIVDYLGKPELLFFGPDEGTAGAMDAVATRARERGYPFWRTLTTGKSSGLPHDVYGLLDDGRVFGLHACREGTALELEGEEEASVHTPEDLVSLLQGRVQSSGMTTTGVMATFRTLVDHLGLREEELPLMMTGGPDGDLGANQIQCYRGPICLVIDSGGVLFDPHGLDRTELLRLAVSRHPYPRPNCADYPVDRLSAGGFLVRGTDRNVTLPGGQVVVDGAYFHRNFLSLPEFAPLLRPAGLRAFIPCGGFRSTINFSNVAQFLEGFPDLQIIVEGANVFFDDPARQAIAESGGILQIRDSSANKGGVTASSLGEVLSGLILGDDYDRTLAVGTALKQRLVKTILQRIEANAAAETTMLLKLHQNDPTMPLYRLSIQTSEQLLGFQAELTDTVLADMLRDQDCTDSILRCYIPSVLVELAGMSTIRDTFSKPELRGYRDALLTKALAARGLYRYGEQWDAFLLRFRSDPLAVVAELASD